MLGPSLCSRQNSEYLPGCGSAWGGGGRAGARGWTGRGKVV